MTPTFHFLLLQKKINQMFQVTIILIHFINKKQSQFIFNESAYEMSQINLLPAILAENVFPAFHDTYLSIPRRSNRAYTIHIHKKKRICSAGCNFSCHQHQIIKTQTRK